MGQVWIAEQIAQPMSNHRIRCREMHISSSMRCAKRGWARALKNGGREFSRAESGPETGSSHMRGLR